MVVVSLYMAEAKLLAELELGVWLVVLVQEGVWLQGRRGWVRKIGVDHNTQCIGVCVCVVPELLVNEFLNFRRFTNLRHY